MTTRLTNGLVLVLLLAWAGALGARLSHASAPYDDAFITFRYARNLAEGRGFVYNTGEPSAGTTSPAYALVLAGLSKASGADPAGVANWISAFAIALGAWCAFLLVSRDFGVLAGLTAGASAALNPILLSSWGGEWLVAVAALAMAFFAYRSERLVTAALLGSLAVVLRSDAAIGLAILFAHMAWTRRGKALPAIALSLGVGVAWAGVSWAVTGEVMPETFAVKLAHGRSGLFATLLGGFYQGVKAFVDADRKMLAIVILAWHGSLVAALKRGVWTIVGFWIVAHALFYTLLHLPFYHWYLVPIAFGISLAAGIGVAAVQMYLGEALPNRVVARLAAAATVAVLVVAGLAAEARSSRDWIRAKPDARERAYNELGEWLAANTPEDASVAYLEVGRVGYFSRRRIVDMMGLITPGVSRHVESQDILWSVYAHKPDYYVTSSMFTWAGTLAGEPWFESAYERVRTTTPEGLDTVIDVYRKRPGASFPEPPAIEGVQLWNNAIVGEMLPGTSYGQTFAGSRPGLTEVAVLFGTLARVNRGTMEFRLERLSPDPRTVVEGRFPMEEVQDNAWRRFTFSSQPDSNGATYRLTISAVDSAPGNAVTLWYYNRDRYRAGQRLVNGAAVRGDLALKLFYGSAAAER